MAESKTESKRAAPDGIFIPDCVVTSMMTVSVAFVGTAVMVAALALKGRAIPSYVTREAVVCGMCIAYLNRRLPDEAKEGSDAGA